jgi:pimeloyl-ACP methyl ester carboxylesterase
MKKIIICLVFSLLLPHVSFAYYYVPSFTLTLTKITTSGDGTFNFGAYSSNNVGFNLTPDQQKQITTINGQKSVNFYLDPGFAYRILENEQQGWNLTGAVCTSTNQSIAFASVNDGVQMSNMIDGNKVNCTFTNSPTVQKSPILIVPGIMGTVILKQNNQQNELIWPDVTRMLNPFHDDSFMDPLANLSDGNLTLGSVIDMAGTLNYTKKLVEDLTSNGYTPGTNLFLFPYDWRRDIYDVAVMDDPQMKNPSLKQMIDQIVSSTGSNKIDIIAHSQGGLVVKSLLSDPEYQGYQSKIDKLVFVGTPNLGAPMAAKALLYGDSMGVSFSGMGLDPAEVKKISKDMPAVYDLLPGSEYFNHTNGYLGTAQVLSNDSPILHVTTLGYASTTEFLENENQNGLNGGLVASSSVFHSPNYDNFDFSNSGIKTYNIVGCQTGTPGKILVKADGTFQIIPTAGDGTVPIFSANNIPGSATLFALESNHATMLTEDGIRQEIVSLITTGAASPQNKITPFVSDCHFDGTEVSTHSPVDLHIYDGMGRHVGPTTDGGFDSDIPNVGYDTIGHEHFAFLPAGGQYIVKLVATGAGSFSFDSSVIQAGQTTGTTNYDSVSITASSTAQIVLNSGNNQSIQLDKNGDGIIDATVTPSSILNMYQPQDPNFPVLTSSASGTLGQPGFYRSSVNVTLSAAYPDIPGQDSQAPAAPIVKYSLDNKATTTYQSSITVADEGSHTISFFSTDKAGDNEQPQTINFTIDKTAPEAVIQFNPALKDIQFTGSDNISTTSKVTVLDNGNDITLTDQAGNITDVKLKEKDRKKSMQATIQSLSYNGAAQDVSKNVLAFLWTYDKSGNLTMLSQNVAAKKTYVILAVYNGKKTSLVGLDKTGVILKSITGLDLLKVITNRGDLTWNY